MANLDEKARMTLAQPEIDKLNELEVQVIRTLAQGFVTTQMSPDKLTPAQLVSMLSERRRIIELRARLTGALPENGGDEYDR